MSSLDPSMSSKYPHEGQSLLTHFKLIYEHDTFGYLPWGQTRSFVTMRMSLPSPCLNPTWQLKSEPHLPLISSHITLEVSQLLLNHYKFTEDKNIYLKFSGFALTTTSNPITLQANIPETAAPTIAKSITTKMLLTTL